MPESDLPIIIIGAGISGLSLAQYLRREKIPYHVFERDASVDARPGGWGLTLHWGLPALQELLPPELYDRLKETNVNVEAVNDPGRYLFFDLKNGEPKYSLDFPKTGRLRVLRTKLRKLLTTGLDISVSLELQQSLTDPPKEDSLGNPVALLLAKSQLSSLFLFVLPFSHADLCLSNPNC